MDVAREINGLLFAEDDSGQAIPGLEAHFAQGPVFAGPQQPQRSSHEVSWRGGQARTIEDQQGSGSGRPVLRDSTAATGSR